MRAHCRVDRSILFFFGQIMNHQSYSVTYVGIEMKNSFLQCAPQKFSFFEQVVVCCSQKGFREKVKEDVKRKPQKRKLRNLMSNENNVAKCFGVKSQFLFIFILACLRKYEISKTDICVDNRLF